MSSAAESERSPRPSFDAIYASELRYVVNSLRRLGIPLRDLEDVAHEVFVVVHEKLPTYDPARPVRPWLFGIAFRVASTYRRKRSHRNEGLRADGEAPLAPPSDPWPVHQTRQLVVRALDTLAWEPRAVLILHDIDGATASEISETLEMPVNRVYSRVRIARRDFRRAVAELSGEEP